MAKLVIGISGWYQNGKDTFYDIIEKYSGLEVKRFAFADALKDEVWENVLKQFDTPREHLDNNNKFLYRPLLQWYGTDFRRTLYGDTYWIDKVKNEIINYPGIAIITDCRFVGEADMIKSLGGKVFRVKRPGFLPNDHSSEHDLDNYNFDAIIDNDGTIEDLRKYLYLVK